MTMPKRIWAQASRATVYMDGSQPVVASTRDTGRGFTPYHRDDVVQGLADAIAALLGCDPGADDTARAALSALDTEEGA